MAVEGFESTSELLEFGAKVRDGSQDWFLSAEAGVNQQIGITLLQTMVSAGVPAGEAEVMVSRVMADFTLLASLSHDLSKSAKDFRAHLQVAVDKVHEARAQQRHARKGLVVN